MSATTPQRTDVLDNPMWETLNGAHAHLSEGTSRARRYRPQVSSLVGVDDLNDPQTWVDLAYLIGPGAQVALSHGFDRLPADWSVVMDAAGVQMVATDALVAEPFDEAVRLGADDVDDMLALIARTQPGPFSPETYRLGNYLGIRRHGQLIAMTGERLHPPGWTEISAVCTDAEFRGQGLARRLVSAVAGGIYARGETPFLHAAADNTTAIDLYLRMGFEVRKQLEFTIVQSPSS